MGTITDISRQKRNTSRVSVYVDGEFVCGLDAVTAVASRLKIGDTVDAEELSAVAKKSDINSAFERAAAYLSTSPRSKLEIERYLGGKGYDKDIVREVSDRLVQYRYIDDRAYAENFIKSKSKKYGEIRLSAELRKKGISAEIISELLSGDGNDYGERYDETESAIAVATKYLRSHRVADKLKLKRYLAGRGYTWDSVNAAISGLERDGAFERNDDDCDI